MNSTIMYRTIYHLAIALVLCMSLSAGAQARPQQPLNSEEREKVLSEMRAYKHDVLTRELSLTKEQQQEFFPVYDEMDDQLIQINYETRELERKMIGDEEASDIELEAAANAIFAQKQREGKIEMEYFEKFKETLTPRQLLKLKSAEKKFTQTLVRHKHRRTRER